VAARWAIIHAPMLVSMGWISAHSSSVSMGTGTLQRQQW